MTTSVYVNLSGGLGNQMMQLYAANELATKLGVKLYLNLSWFKREHKSQKITTRKFELECFSLNCNFDLIYLKKWQLFAFRRFGNRVNSRHAFESALRKIKIFGPILIDYHCADISISHRKFKSIFKWKEIVFPKDLLLMRESLNQTNLPAIFLRKDDWTSLSPDSVVSEICFEQKIELRHRETEFIIGQIGKDPVMFNDLKVHCKFIDDCNKGWRSYEKMYLLSAASFLYTSNSTYGRCAMLLTLQGEGKIVEPCAT